MAEKPISRKEENHIEALENEIDRMDDMDYFCCCKEHLVDELETRDRIRSVVMPGTVLYDGGNIRRFLAFLSMYPSFTTVSEVVEDIAAYNEECVSD
jgi:hypothetical protein